MEHFQEYMPAELAGCRIEVGTVYRTNREEVGLTLIKPDTLAGLPSMTLCVSDLYERYQENGSVEETLSEAADMLADIWMNRSRGTENFSLSEARERVVMQLVNTELNERLLRDSPSRPFHDLSIIYKIVAAVDEYGIRSARVTNDLAERIGMDEQSLYEAALKNTKKMFPPVMMYMNGMSMVRLDNRTWEGMEAEFENRIDGEEKKKMPLFMISNDRFLKGAVSMLYEENLHTLAERLGTDLYILPSSVHEVIAMPVDFMSPYDAARMVEEINMAEVAPEDRLSNQVYQYDKELRQIVPVPDVPAKEISMDETGLAAVGKTKEQAR